MYNIVVILSTYNGSEFIREQLNSLADQKIDDMLLYVRDDGSSDDTVEILKSYKDRLNIQICKGKNVGAKNSFIEAIFDAPEARYYALADQDDIWYENKLSVAVDKISGKEQFFDGLPILYHSAANLVDENGTLFGKCGKYKERKFLCGETFYVIGCTAVYNKALRDLLIKHRPTACPMHDAWIHNICLAVGGSVIYDDEGLIGYRQHGKNEVGAAKGLFAAIRRRFRYYKKRVKNQNLLMYKDVLDNYRDVMPEENIERCEKICSYKSSFKNTVRVLTDKKFFKGRFWWSLEQRMFILFRVY